MRYRKRIQEDRKTWGRMAADANIANKEGKLPQKEKKRIIVEIDQIPGVNPNVKARASAGSSVAAGAGDAAGVE